MASVGKQEKLLDRTVLLSCFIGQFLPDLIKKLSVFRRAPCGKRRMVCGSQVNGKFCFDTGGAGRQDENAIGEADSFCKIVGDEDDGFFCLTDHGSNIGETVSRVW